MRFKAEILFLGTLCDTRWSFTQVESFHLVVHGQCVLTLLDKPQHPPIVLKAGQMVFLPNDARHRISSTVEVAKENCSIDGPELSSLSDEGTALVCGLFRVDALSRRLLLAGLPDVVVMDRACMSTAEQGVHQLIELMLIEAEQPGLGQQAVLDRLSDALFFLMLRYTVGQCSIHASGILSAFADERLSQLLQAVNEAPHKGWDTEMCAGSLYLSRSALSRHCTEITGLSPGLLVALWKMSLAQERLASGKQSVAQIAEALGFGAEASFRKAFKRLTGQTPGDYCKGCM